ncbi:Fructose-1,6-bisphosphatase class 1 [Candidatus Calditenuaceae archaeon HR02]|nr:Fructose-1,6-bisphosphatase class 1 [Candidatus Calditenuaceae archaeon HR02]
MLRDVVGEALRAARDALLDTISRGSVGEPMGRGSYGDISYRGDLVCERAIVDVLNSRLGSVAIVSEEMGVAWRGTGEPEYWALIDPVDGSANMSRGISFYSSGVALARGPLVRDVLSSGVIDHLTGEIFIREERYVSHKTSSDPSRASQEDGGRATLFFHHASFKRDPQSRKISIRIAERLRFFRVMGSALLEMCYASVGRVDGYLCLTPELRMMDIVPALYFAMGMSCRSASYPRPLLDERLDSRSRYGIIIGSKQDVFEDIVSMLGDGWSILV